MSDDSKTEVSKLRPMKPRLGTPEQQKANEEFSRQIGQALVDNLNRNVLRKQSEHPAKDEQK